MSPNIHSSTAGDGADVILLHGLFGMGNNLGVLARSLQDRYRVHSLDLPNHGRSGWLDKMTLDALAGAVRDWMAGQGVERAHLVGHSLGGKVAMRIALDAPQRVARLVVADIAPVVYPSHHEAVFAALEAVALEAPSSRTEADLCMAAHVEEEGVRQFLALSLVRGEDGRYRWRFNLEGLKRDYAAVREALSAAEPFPGETLFIKGELSDYILPEHREAIAALFPQARFKVLQGCGHWLHAQQPRLFNSVVGRFLDGG